MDRNMPNVKKKYSQKIVIGLLSYWVSKVSDVRVFEFLEWITMNWDW